MEIDKIMPELPIEEDVVVFGLKYTPQENMVFIGNIKSGGQLHSGAYSNKCDYLDVISLLRKKARLSGSNIIKINDFEYPTFSSKCIKIDADLYYTEDVKSTIENYYKKNIRSQNSNEATVYFMRPYIMPGSGLAARIYSSDESHINNVYSGFVYHHKIRKEGAYSFYIEGNEEMKANLNIEMGNEYYVLINFDQGWVKTGFKVEDVTVEKSHYENKAQVIELIPKYAKEK